MVNKKKKDVPVEKNEIPLKKTNLDRNNTEIKIKEKLQSSFNWVEDSGVGLTIIKARKESLQISSLKSFDLEADMKGKRKQTLKSKSFLIGPEAEQPLEKIYALEGSPIATVKSFAKQRKTKTGGTLREIHDFSSFLNLILIFFSSDYHSDTET